MTTISGTNDSDLLNGTSSSEVISGGNGNDSINGDGGDDQLLGGNGSDQLDGGSGNDLLSGGNGVDWLVGGSGNDVLSGDNGDDFLDGGAGSDTLYGGNGKDTAIYRGPMGNYLFERQADGAIRVYDTTGADGDDLVYQVSYFKFSDGTVNAANLTFGVIPDPDTVDYSWTTQGVTVDLALNSASGPEIGTEVLASSIVNVIGGSGNDNLRGDDGANKLFGGAGNDMLSGRGGDDLLDGGDGIDEARYALTTLGITADLALGTVSSVEFGNDTLVSIENLVGGSGNDTLRGDGGNNTLNGNDGNDFLVGRAGDDVLNGGNGIDVARFAGNRSAYTFAPGTVTGPDGTDTTNGVELLRFDDSYMLGFGLTPINLAGFTLDAGAPIFGRSVSDLLTVGANAGGRLINLGGDNDTLTIALGGPSPQSINLNVANVETIGTFAFTGSLTINMAPTSILNGTTVDLGSFSDTLNLANGNNVVTTIGVETINAFGTGNDTVTFVGDGTLANYTVNLGGGTNALNLAGTSSTFGGMSISGSNLTVVGQTTGAAGGNENVTLTNVQAGTTFDLGSGNDSLTLFNDGVHVNVVSVKGIENVTAVGFDSDQIHILGNAGGVTTVTAGGGADLLWASADADHFRFITTGDSPYDIPFGGQRDVVDGFDAAEDVFVFDGIPGTSSPTWELINFGGAQIVRVDINGDASGETGWDMAIQVDGLIGTLTDSNFQWLI